jgi:hypothetical protein
MAPIQFEVQEWMRETDDGLPHPDEPVSQLEAIEQLKQALGWSEFCRDSLRFELEGLHSVRRKDNEFFLGEIKKLESCLKNLVRQVDKYLPEIADGEHTSLADANEDAKDYMTMRKGRP